MTIAQTSAFVKHNVDFNVQLVAAVVRLQALDSFDGLGEAHGEVEQNVALVGGGGGAGEVADVL